MAPIQDQMSRRQKAVILSLLDAALSALALLVALQLRMGDWWPDQYFADGWGLFVALPLAGIALGWNLGIPHVVLRAFEHRALMRLGRYTIIMAVICAALNTTFEFGLPRSIPGIWAALFLMFAVTARLTLLEILGLQRPGGGAQRNVAIYGAGATGQQLMAALNAAPEIQPVVFLDDNPGLRKTQIGGLRVYSPDALAWLISRHKISQVILAMPSVAPSVRRRIIRQLKTFEIEVLTLPSFVELLDGRALSDTLRPVSPDELLGREAVDLTSDTVAAAYLGKSVMITGAGGSIGSELARQIVEARPSRIVLFDQSEAALYQIDRDCRALAGPKIEVVARLGSVGDPARVAEVLAEFSVAIILHAAAYKHVPLVEENPLEGARNNILGTQIMADAALAAGVERFILVSTDKAVRPTNVMGATKRLAEMVIQDRQRQGKATVFTMVRFGNVLGSSGSVVPLFRAQIDAGGPVTLTHLEVTRYFMTIPEAAQLVLLAGSFAEGGEVFVLDMGKPVKIADLARSLIELSGLSVRDATNPDGDIEIKVTGLRPGEKLYEELLIGGDTIATPHPKILRAMEAAPTGAATAKALTALGEIIATGDEPGLKTLLAAHVDGYATPAKTAAQ